MSAATKGSGHPRTGLRPGEKSSDYHQLTIRVPESTVRLLRAANAALSRSRWRLITEALQVYLADGKPLTAEQRAAVQRVERALPKETP